MPCIDNKIPDKTWLAKVNQAKTAKRQKRRDRPEAFIELITGSQALLGW